MNERVVATILAAGLWVTCIAAGEVRADSWFPLAVGNTWHYEGDEGAIETQSITRTDVMRGRPVFVNTYTENIENAGLENYWMESESGDILLAGFWRKFDGFGVLYEPPLTWIDAPLALGKTWTTATEIFELPGMVPSIGIEFTFEVLEAGPLTVPAGTFDAYGFAMTFAAPNLLYSVPYELDGRAKPSGTGATDWHSLGAGAVQYRGSSLFKLASFEKPTPTAAASWGSVKRTYR